MQDGDAPLIDKETTWRVTSGTTPSMRFWDGECVVYSALTGSTHLLDGVAGELLGRIVAGAITTRALCAHLAANLGIADDEDVRERVIATLAVLDELRLIEPATR